MFVLSFTALAAAFSSAIAIAGLTALGRHFGALFFQDRLA
jgi:hypothetical protein